MSEVAVDVRGVMRECSGDQLVGGKGEGSKARRMKSCLPWGVLRIGRPSGAVPRWGGGWVPARPCHSAVVALGKGWGGLLGGGSSPAPRPSSAPEGCPPAASWGMPEMAAK